MPSCHRGPVCPMTGKFTNSQKMLLAAAITEGSAVANWASSNSRLNLHRNLLTIMPGQFISHTRSAHLDEPTLRE